MFYLVHDGLSAFVTSYIGHGRFKIMNEMIVVVARKIKAKK
jgi:hypothetical protein